MSVGLSRRALIVGGASLAGAGWVGISASRAVAVTSPVKLRGLSMRRSAFLPLLGQKFEIAHEGGSLAVVLRQVANLKPCVKRGAEDQFSLIFSGSGRRRALSQGTYSVRHPRRGRISLFIVPVGVAAAGGSKTDRQYQVIIDSRPLASFRS